MSDEGQRIEFGGKGPYLFDAIDGEPQAMLLDEHNVCLLQFGGLYLPVAVDACPKLAAALSTMSDAAIGPEREGMTPIAFDLNETTELPLLTDVADESFQHGEIIYVDVMFGETQVRLCFTIIAAAIVGQVMSQIPKDN